MSALAPQPFEEPPPLRGKPLSAAEFAHLLPGAAVVLVLVAAHALFDFAGLDMPGLRALARLPDGIDPGSAIALREGEARTLWLATALLYGVVSLAALITAVWITRHCVRGRCLMQIGTIAATLCALGIVHLILSAEHRRPVAGVFFFTHEALAESPFFTASEVAGIEAALDVINLLSVLVPAAVLAAGCAVLVPPEPGRRRRLGEYPWLVRLLKDGMNAASAVLVVGILHMLAWLRWAIPLADPDLQGDVQGLTMAVAFYWGTAFSLMIAAFYIPATIMLSRQTEAALRRAKPAECPQDPRAWMRQEGLSLVPSQHLPKVLVVLAPLLAGPLGSALTDFVQPAAFIP